MAETSDKSRSVFTVGRTLVGVVTVLTACVVAFASIEIAGTVQRTQDAAKIVDSTDVSDLLITSAGNWAVERGITNAALSAPDPAADDRIARIMSRRQAADDAFRNALDKIRSGPAFRGREQVIQRASRAFDEAVQLRERVDTALSRSKSERESEVMSAWVPSMTKLIMQSQELRLRADYQPRFVDAQINALRSFRHDIWVMSEYAGRERAIIGGLIDSKTALTADSIERLARFRGHLVEAWTRAQIFVASGRASEAIVGEIKDVEANFFGKYEDVRNAVYSSGTKGASYPMSSGEWIATATAAIDKLLELAEAASRETHFAAETEKSDSIVSLIGHGIALLLVLLVAGFSFWVIVGRVVRPIGAMSKSMLQLADGKLDIEVPSLDRRDEIGEMASSVETFKQNAIETERMRKERREEEAKAAERELKSRRELADAFETSIGGVIDALTSAATELNATAESMSAIAAETNEQSSSVASASEQASANVQTVAAAAEELSKSISEIAEQVERSTRSAKAAVDGVRGAESRTETLSDAAEEIGVVLDMIKEIADQTNLLALNATIEAARAGESGKGFAVVAQEVKSLASQTGAATGKIADLVGRIRSETAETRDAIGKVRELVAEIDGVANSIAAAIEEQNASTGEISRNVAEASTGAAEVSRSIVSVKSAAGEAGSAATQVVTASNDLSEQAGNLKREVSGFLDRVRAA